MIIWIASYPKSGNTWLRSIISSLIYSKDGIFNFKLIKKIHQFPEKIHFKDLVKDFGSFDEIKRNWILAQDKINLNNKINFFKTHQGKYTVGRDSFTNDQNTKAVIYVVRDPRNVVMSLSNHYSMTIDESLEFMLSPSIIGNSKSYEESVKENKASIYTLLGKWNEHYRSWTRKKGNLLLIKYEDLISDPLNELEKIISFLKNFVEFETNNKKNHNILETTSFENLKKMENKNLFTEGVLNKHNKSKVNFFNLGPDNKWQNSLNSTIVNSLEKNFCDEMKELKYL